MNRREFLFYCGAGILSSMVPWGFKGLLAAATEKNAVGAGSRRKLIVIFQRGGIDGLNVVIPFTDSRYYDARPTIAIAPPGAPQGALDLDGTFGLHPSLAMLKPLWKNKTLGFVHACGSPNPSRIHLEAQRNFEAGVQDRSYTNGWLNRLLGLLPKTKTQSLLGIGSKDPFILRGPYEGLMQKESDAAMEVTAFADLPLVPAPLEQLYRNDALANTFEKAVEDRHKWLAELQGDERIAVNGAPGLSQFANNCVQVGRVFAQNPALRIAFLDVAGWDTHRHQGNHAGQLASRLETFGEGLQSLVEGLDDSFHDTLIVVVSEFGRTLKENALGGTDHGRGNVCWLLGGSVAGGKVHCEWPGLKEDLAVTTDLRHVLGFLIGKHMGLVGTDVQMLFPDMPLPTFKQQKVLENLLVNR